MFDFTVLPAATPARAGVTPAVPGVVTADSPDAAAAFGSLIDALSRGSEQGQATPAAGLAEPEAADVEPAGDEDATADPLVQPGVVGHTTPLVVTVQVPAGPADVLEPEAEPAPALAGDSTAPAGAGPTPAEVTAPIDTTSKAPLTPMASRADRTTSSFDGSVRTLDGSGASPRPSGEAADAPRAASPAPVVGKSAVVEEAAAPDEAIAGASRRQAVRPAVVDPAPAASSRPTAAVAPGETPIKESAVEQAAEAVESVVPTTPRPSEERSSRMPADPSIAEGPTRAALAAAATRTTRRASAEPGRPVAPAIEAPADPAADGHASGARGRTAGVVQAAHDVPGAEVVRPVPRADSDSPDLMRHFSAPQPSVAVKGPAMPAVAVMQAPAAGEVSPAQIAAQVVQSIHLLVTRNGGEARLRLEPEYLGQLTVTMKLERSGVSATIQAETPVVRESLQANEGLLRQALGEHGLRLDRLDVTEPTREETFEDERQRSGEEPRERRSRRDRDADATTARFEVVA